jgi:nucleotide-binding universal stress UspA family protein
VGSLTHKLAREATSPLLIARNVPARLHRLLVCTAGEAASFDTLRLSGQLLAHTDTEVGLLHVMSQVALRVDSPPADLHDSAESAIERHTREGQHLQRGRSLLQQMGVRGPVIARLRHGLVVDQVLAEMVEGKYDLLVVGGHYQINLNRWMQILLEDVTSQLLARSPSSVLVV